MNINSKYTPVNIIANLLLVDLWQLRQIQRKALDERLRSELIIAIDSIQVELDRIFERVKDYSIPAHMQEDLAATAFADCRKKFNIVKLRNTFIEQNGQNFRIVLTVNNPDGSQSKQTFSTTLPQLVSQKITRAVRDPDIVFASVTLFKKRPDHFSYEELYNIPTGSDLLENMFNHNPQRYIDIALIAASPEMVLKFARRPPQEYHNASYWRAKTPVIQGGMMP